MQHHGRVVSGQDVDHVVDRHATHLGEFGGGRHPLVAVVLLAGDVGRHAAIVIGLLSIENLGLALDVLLGEGLLVVGRLGGLGGALRDRYRGLGVALGAALLSMQPCYLAVAPGDLLLKLGLLGGGQTGEDVVVLTLVCVAIVFGADVLSEYGSLPCTAPVSPLR